MTKMVGPRKRVNGRSVAKGIFGSVRGEGTPGKPRMNLTRPDFTQRHYERLADSFRDALLQFPNGDPLHPGVCFMMQKTLKMLQEDNPNFDEWRFIEWANTP